MGKRSRAIARHPLPPPLLPEDATMTADEEPSSSRPAPDSVSSLAGELWSVLTIFCVCIGIYGWTLHSSIPGGDSGELVAVSCSLGVAHAPGYPLFTLLTWLFLQAPWSSAASQKAAMLSMLSGGIAASLLYLTCFLLTRRRLSSAFATLLFVLSPTAWQYFTIPEVFAVHLALIMALLFLWVRHCLSPSLSIARLAAFIIGLGLSHQHIFILYAIPLVIAALLFNGSLRQPRPLFSVVLCGLLGLLPYIYLPLAAMWSSSWSKWGDPRTWNGFLHVLLRRDYGTFRLGSKELGEAVMQGARLSLYLVNLLRESLGWAFLALPGAYAGLRAGAQKGRRLAVGGMLCCWACFLIVFVSLSNLPINTDLMRSVQQRFYPQGHVVVFLLCGLGASWIQERVGRERMRSVLLLYAVGVLLATQVTMNAPPSTKVDLPEQYGRVIMDSLPPNTLLLTKGDLNVNVIRYLQQCEGVRPDVTILDQETMSYEWFVPVVGQFYADRHVILPGRVYDPFKVGGFSIVQLLKENMPHRPIFLTGGWKYGDNSGDLLYDQESYGLVFRLRPKSQSLHFREWMEQSERSVNATLNLALWKRDAEHRLDEWEYAVTDDAYSSSHAWAYRLIVEAIKEDWKGSVEAVAALQRSIRVLEALDQAVAPVDPKERDAAVDMYDRSSWLYQLLPPPLAKRDARRTPTYVLLNTMIGWVHLHGTELVTGKYRCSMLHALKRYMTDVPPDDPYINMAQDDYFREKRNARLLHHECSGLVD